MKILGYFVDAGEAPTANTVFVAIKSEGEYMAYCPIGQHSKLDKGYLQNCEKIRKDQYMIYSNGLYTPREYL